MLWQVYLYDLKQGWVYLHTFRQEHEWYDEKLRLRACRVQFKVVIR